MKAIAIVLDTPSYVRAKIEPEGSVFYVNKTIGRYEAYKLVMAGKAHKESVIETRSAYIDDQA